jgi:hypothetical protein
MSQTFVGIIIGKYEHDDEDGDGIKGGANAEDEEEDPEEVVYIISDDEEDPKGGCATCNEQSLEEAQVYESPELLKIFKV